MPLMVASFPAHYAGRVSTSSNLVVFSVIFAGQWAIGKVVDLWPRTATGYSPDGYSLGLRRAVHPAACGSPVAGSVAGSADGAAASRRGRLSADTRSRTSWRAATWLERE